MRRTAVFLGVTLAVGIAVGAIGARVLSATQGPVTRTVLLETDLAGMEGKEGFVILAEIPRGDRARGGDGEAHPPCARIRLCPGRRRNPGSGGEAARFVEAGCGDPSAAGSGPQWPEHKRDVCAEDPRSLHRRKGPAPYCTSEIAGSHSPFQGPW
ncbi:MAG: conserved exported protein of unknown function [candidate division NC10 bacterium]|nr:conserved exported protein of unknown function [candidate division NC10 bacterium]